MPIHFQNSTSPNGLRYLTMDAWDRVELEDGRALEAQLLTGRAHHCGYCFARVAKGTEYSHEVRRFLASLQVTITASATVVTSPIARAAISLMLRFSSRDTNVRMFNDEEEALAWLESYARIADRGQKSCP